MLSFFRRVNWAKVTKWITRIDLVVTCLFLMTMILNVGLLTFYIKPTLKRILGEPICNDEMEFVIELQLCKLAGKVQAIVKKYQPYLWAYMVWVGIVSVVRIPLIRKLTSATSDLPPHAEKISKSLSMGLDLPGRTQDCALYIGVTFFFAVLEVALILFFEEQYSGGLVINPRFYLTLCAVTGYRIILCFVALCFRDQIKKLDANSEKLKSKRKKSGSRLPQPKFTVRFVKSSCKAFNM